MVLRINDSRLAMWLLSNPVPNAYGVVVVTVKDGREAAYPWPLVPT